MTTNNDELSNNNRELSPRYDADPVGDKQRREPQFSRFDEDDEDGYEEPDRDTDHASGYRSDDSMEEEEFDDVLPDEDERDLLIEADINEPYESDTFVAEEPDAWLEKEGYLDEDVDEDEIEENGQNWPLSLIAMAIVALVLLIAGGYGVMQQRAATQEEIRQLRAALATTASPEDVQASRVALEDMKQSYDKLSAIAQAMTLENRRLADTVAGLESQLGVQQAVLTKTLPEPRQVKPQPAAPEPAATKSTAPEAALAKPVTAPPAAAQRAVPEPVATPSAIATATGPWFVNFGSYASSNMAQSWAGKLHPGAGKVIVMPNNKDGQTLYRVRVVGLADKISAQAVARELEAQLRVSALWVGKE